ncbi:MAG: methylmalonyl-CoA mutase, partial [Deltaproteobacteria bacterium]|nr:methylmalonyl-CoA mutase [Deltaproteobacteria bacterium]
QQPKNNIVRVAFQAMSAALGGTQSLHTNSMDEAFALPSQEAVTIALRTQQIIAYETGAGDTIDPLAGSYYIESLTDQIEERAAKYIAEIDQMGGAVEAVERGFVQREIQEAAYDYQKAVEAGARVVVGVNKFVTEKQEVPKILRVDPIVREEQAQALADLRAQRDSQAVEAALAALKAAAIDGGNLMPHFLAGVRAYATLGEICDTLRGVFGEYQAPMTI